MPVLVNYTKCNCAPHCFAANACPNNALHVDKTALKVWVEADNCGTCPGPCLNFCDSIALKFAPTLEELAILQKELDGELTHEQAAEARKKMMDEMKALAEAAKQKEELAVHKPMTVTIDNFKQEVGEACMKVPVLIDFWAEWCGPCKQISPALEALAIEFAGKIKFTKINVDEEQMIAQQFGIQSIPTLMILFQGQVADMIVGAMDKTTLRTRLQRVADAVAQLQAQQQATPPTAAKPDPAQSPRPTPKPGLIQPNMVMRQRPPKK
jgi:thioredoxin